jgi:hypothetical protein
MSVSDPVDDLIQKLEALRPNLAAGNDQNARNEAIRLSKQLISNLGHPASTAVDLAFAVWWPFRPLPNSTLRLTNNSHLLLCQLE